MDSEYLKQHVGEVLAIGLTEIVQKRPVDPIEYLAHWLRKFVENRDFDLRKKEEMAALELEKKAAEEEKQRQMKMKEEAEVIARQEAYEKAAQEEVVIDTTPRPIPPEVSGTLPSVAEGDEEEAERLDDSKSAEAKNADTTTKEDGQLPTLSEEVENNGNTNETPQKDEQMEKIEESKTEAEESKTEADETKTEADETKTETEEQKPEAEELADNKQEEEEGEKETAEGDQTDGAEKPDDAPAGEENAENKDESEKAGDDTEAEK